MNQEKTGMRCRANLTPVGSGKNRAGDQEEMTTTAALFP